MTIISQTFTDLTSEQTRLLNRWVINNNDKMFVTDNEDVPFGVKTFRLASVCKGLESIKAPANLPDLMAGVEESARHGMHCTERNSFRKGLL